MADSEFLVAQLESPIITLIIDSGGRTLRSPGILEYHNAAESIIKAIIITSK